MNYQQVATLAQAKACADTVRSKHEYEETPRMALNQLAQCRVNNLEAPWTVEGEVSLDGADDGY